MSSHGDAIARRTAVLGVALVALTVLTLLMRIPSEWKTLSDQASVNASASPSGLAAADSIDVDNPFAEAATRLIPGGASFAVLAPSTSSQEHDRISPVTAFALPGYFQYLLLPRRELPVDRAQYLLCYACSGSDIRRSVTWIYTSPNQSDLHIGRLGR